MVVDDNTFDLYEFRNNYKNVNFIQVSDEICKLSGYMDTNFVIHKLISGWDKALYYFGTEDTNYDFIWMIEDDVFFYNENTIVNIDNQYVNDDLITKNYTENSNGDKNDWHWSIINIQYPPPYYWSMVCAVRLSNSLMSCINTYATENKTLFFCEALIPTIAIKNDLKYSNPTEFTNIYFRHDFDAKDIDTINLYHPVKDCNNHILFRKLLNNLP
jgi:hypothetical protein